MRIQRLPRSRRGIAAATAVTLAVLAGGSGLLPGTGVASSHREAPLTSAEPQVDDTDVYAFVPASSPGDVVLIGNWIPFEHPTGGPNFYPFSPDARYHINIDNNGDSVPDVIYRWEFRSHYRNPDSFLYNTGVVSSIRDATLNFYQTYTLTEITTRGARTLLRNAPVAPSRVGDASMPNYAALRAEATLPLPGGGMSFAGQSDDPFFLDLRVFDLLYGGNFSEAGANTLKGYNVNTIALQVPKSDVALKGNVARNPVIGVWTTTERRSTLAGPASGTSLYTGPYRQVSRLGNPLVNEVVIPVGKKDLFNATGPRTDGQFLKQVTNPELPKVIEAVYGIPAPKVPRLDLVEVFLTGIYRGSSGVVQADLNSQLINKDVNRKRFVPGDQLRLNLAVPPAATPNRLGVLGGDLAGFPNGRRLGDDIVDVSLRVVEGVLRANHAPGIENLSDGVDANDVPFLDTFPYTALPHSGSSLGPRG